MYFQKQRESLSELNKTLEHIKWKFLTKTLALLQAIHMFIDLENGS